MRNADVAMGAESPALIAFNGSDPDGPSVTSSAASPGWRTGFSPDIRLPISRTTPAFQRVKASDVRRAPFKAEPGRNGPDGPAQKVGMCRLSTRACSQYADELACSKGMRRSAKF